MRLGVLKSQNPLTAKLGKEAPRTQRLVLHAFNFAHFAYTLSALWLKLLLPVAFLFFHAFAFSQNIPEFDSLPEPGNYKEIYGTLASDSMEGREAGTRGGLMAAYFIASMLQTTDILPFGKKWIINNPETKLNSYFQDFELVKYKNEVVKFSLIKKFSEADSMKSFETDSDYKVISGPNDITVDAPLVFAGYGLTIPEINYDDYETIDIKGKIVLLLKGFPGHSDRNSRAWRIFNKTTLTDTLEDTKMRNANLHGALGIVEIDMEGINNMNEILLRKMSTQNIPLVAQKEDSLIYTDAEYELLIDTVNQRIPVFKTGALNFPWLAETGVDFIDYEKRASKLQVEKISRIKDLNIRYSINSEKETLLVQNIIGILPGTDTTRYVILGAHYDHLGKRGGLIYFGADDNASGVAGLLSLADTWAKRGIKPEVNIVFAFWTAEEKGLLGSNYFVNSYKIPRESILLYVNLDMISRSVAEDNEGLQLSIGTRKSDENLREMMMSTNKSLPEPFKLDLWDVTGRSGSDYASFTEKNLPILTFNTGLHIDYHTSRDIVSKADFRKMENVLKLVNESLQFFTEKVKDN